MTKTTTEMQLVPITKLVPYVNNARTHSSEQITKLRSSLREFGFINPVIIDRDFNVIAGHGRILAAKEEGITEVPCVFADHLSEAQKKAYIIAGFDRSRSCKTELLAKVFDHCSMKDKRGFRMLTLGWSDGNSFIPVNHCHAFSS